MSKTSTLELIQGGRDLPVGSQNDLVVATEEEIASGKINTASHDGVPKLSLKWALYPAGAILKSAIDVRDATFVLLVDEPRGHTFQVHFDGENEPTTEDFAPAVEEILSFITQQDVTLSPVETTSGGKSNDENVGFKGLRLVRSDE